MNTSMKETENKGPFPKVLERVAAACGIGKQTIRDIVRKSPCYQKVRKDIVYVKKYGEA
jgi:hypothetical protein